MRLLATSLTVGLLVGLFVVIGGQVILRSLGHPLVWAEEASVIAFCWLIFAGAALAYLNREHLEVDLLYNALKARLGRRQKSTWEKLILLFQITFLSVFFVGLVIMTEQTWSASIGSVAGFRYAWIYLGVAVGVALCLLALLRQAIGRSDVVEDTDKP